MIELSSHSLNLNKSRIRPNKSRELSFDNTATALRRVLFVLLCLWPLYCSNNKRYRSLTNPKMLIYLLPARLEKKEKRSKNLDQCLQLLSSKTTKRRQDLDLHLDNLRKAKKAHRRVWKLLPRRRKRRAIYRHILRPTSRQMERRKISK